MARPNILFLIADDHRHDVLGLVGPPAQTPHLDALAARGTRFTRHHCQGGMTGAICAPSRACILSGRELFAATVSTTPGTPGTGDLPDELTTLPQALRADGYRTHGVGKWHNGRASFHRSFASGARIFFGGMSDHRAVPVHGFDPTGEYPPEAAHPADGFSTDVFADAVIDFLDERAGVSDGQPFFCWAAFTAPHDPRTPPPEFARAHRAEDLALPENFGTRPPSWANLGERDEGLAALPRDPDEVRGHLADYHAMVSHLDAGVGRILDHMARTGLAEDTIVVYTADHGLALGQHGLLGKQNLYDHSLRVPLLVAGPGVPAGRTVDALTIHADLFATLAARAGTTVPPSVTGNDLTPLLERPGSPGGRAIVHAAYLDRDRMASDGQHKLVRHRVPVDSVELFDLAADPAETVNLADDPSLAAVRDRLDRSLRDWQRASGDPLAAR